MGLLGILGLLVAGGSAVKCAAEDNSYRNNDSFLLPDGKTRVYIDRKGFCRKMDGTLVVNPAGDRIVDGKGNLIYDRAAAAREAAQQQRIDDAKRWGKLAYERKVDKFHSETVEFSTGKVISRLAYDYKNLKFAKKYLGDPVWHLVTLDEVNKLNIILGGHYVTKWDDLRRKHPWMEEKTNWWEEPARD